MVECCPERRIPETHDHYFTKTEQLLNPAGLFAVSRAFINVCSSNTPQYISSVPNVSDKEIQQSVIEIMLSV